jgi:hypothetical protein
MYRELTRSTSRPPVEARASTWHVVRQDTHTTLCRRVLAPDAETGPVQAEDEAPPELLCPACRAENQELEAKSWIMT